MSFQARLQTLEPFETWPSLHSAAVERYWDGIELAISQAPHRTGAIYLLGYVAEMLLKVAFYRINGLADVAEARYRLLTAHTLWRGRNAHDLVALADLLIAERQRRNQAFNPIFAGQLQTCVLVLASHWQESLRYRQTPAHETELSEVFQNVDWMLGNATLLWS